MRLWPLFGTTNQLTAALSLLVITLFLIRLGRSVWISVIPMVFLFFMTTWAMVLNLLKYWSESHAVLLVVGGAVFVLELWPCRLRRVRGHRWLARTLRDVGQRFGGRHNRVCDGNR